jgi:hypothetical protein
MKSEEIKQIANKAIEQLIAALNEGRSETLTQYLAAIGRFHRYSLRNVMLIASQKPTATHVAGFHAWHKLGRFVKKGEKGILILAPIVRRKNESTEQSETDESSTAVGFRAAYVFDISQTDGQELPEIGCVSGDPSGYRARLGNFVTEQGITLEYSQDIAPARGPLRGERLRCSPANLPQKSLQRSFMRSRMKKCTVTSAVVALRSVAVKPRPRPLRSSSVRPSDLRWARQRRTISNFTRGTQNF